MDKDKEIQGRIEHYLVLYRSKEYNKRKTAEKILSLICQHTPEDKAVEEIRKELYLILYSLIKAFGEGLHPGKGKIEVTSYIEQICQLFERPKIKSEAKTLVDIEAKVIEMGADAFAPSEGIDHGR